MDNEILIASIDRGFPKVDRSGIDARIVLEQNKSTKQKIPLTGL